MIVKVILTVTILSVKVTKGEEHNFNYILETKNTFFHKINANVHNAVNQIFRCLRLLKYVTKSTQSELLLKMHNDFLNIAEKNYFAYEHLRNASNTNFIIGDYQSKFLESLNEVIKEETTKHKHTRNKTLNNARNNTEPEESDESLQFLDKFVNKFSKLTIENLTNHEINETSKNSIVKLLIKRKKYELKAWNSTILNGTPSNLTRRLYHGKETRIYNYPFLASIHIFNDFVCSGSIISRDLIITAASCLPKDENTQSVFVRVGSDYTKISGQLIPVTRVYFYPKYDPRSLKHNIAIIRIKKRLKLPANKGRIRRIIYNNKIRKPKDGVYVLGWGVKNPKINPNNLKKLAVDYLDLYSFEDCQDIYTSHYVTDKNFCAGFVEIGSGACNRDVGGPGFHDGILLGIISFGPPVCGTPNNPTVFTNIGYYGTWIDTIVRQSPILQISKPFPSTTRTVQIARTPKSSRPKHFSKKRIHTTTLTTDPPPNDSIDYSQEVNVVKDMLQEIVLTNTSAADYILYGSTIDQQEPIPAHNSYNNDQDYSENSNNNDKLRVHSRTTYMYNDMMDIHDPGTNQAYNNDNFSEHLPRFIESRVYINDLRHEVNEIVNAYTPPDNIYSAKKELKMTNDNDDVNNELRMTNDNDDVNNELRMTNDNDDVNNELRITNGNDDVSENYEENSDHEQGIAIDTNDIALKNISFLDVVYNIKQYQQSKFPNVHTDDVNDKDTISLQLFLGSGSEVDTTRGYRDEIPIRSEDEGEAEGEGEAEAEAEAEAEVELDTEENSRSNNIDEKHLFREENDMRGHYNTYNVPVVESWQAQLAKKLIEKGKMISQQYKIDLKKRIRQKPKTYQ